MGAVCDMYALGLKGLHTHAVYEGVCPSIVCVRVGHIIVQTCHLILDHFIAVKIKAHFLYFLTLLFPLVHFEKYITYNKYI